jgi:kinesin family member C2/C3
LESQLLVERKIARQHVDNKIAQDHQQKQHSLKEEKLDTYTFHQLMSLAEKENNPEARQLLPEKARRLSVCNGGTQLHQPMDSTSRRNSLVPLPIAKPLAAATPPPLDKITEHLSPPMCSPVVSKDKASRSKRISNILHRSLKKKVIIRPSMAAQTGKKTSTAAQGTDVARKVRRLPVSGAAG